MSMTKTLKKFNDDESSNWDLTQMVMREPQHKAELAKFPTHLHMAEECMKNHLVDNDGMGKAE